MSSPARGPPTGPAIAARKTTGHVESSASVGDRHRRGSSTRPGRRTSSPGQQGGHRGDRDYQAGFRG
eukprot:4394950-Heterocapsa_arctica.AAC.1